MYDRTLKAWLSTVNKSILLLGPRQVGKSTLVRSLNPDVYLNLAVERDFLAYAKDPDRLRRELEAVPQARLIAIDEIQRVPALLNSVQVLIDEGDENRKFILTGSSARRLRSSSVNLLPGRILLAHLDPLNIGEMSDSFDLERTLHLGCLPGVYSDTELGEEILGSYAELYLREEIRAESLTRKIGEYARFLDRAALLSGQRINYSKVSLDTEIPKETIRRFFALLEDTLLIHRLPPFKPKEKTSRRVSQRDRLLFFDVGVRNAILGIHSQTLTSDQRGALFEQWIILQLFTMNRAYRAKWNFSSYRTNAGAEVDLIIERPNDIIALEIKHSTSIFRSQLSGLESFEKHCKDYKPVKKWICYRGERPQSFENGSTAFNFRELLEQLASEMRGA